jgi:hypothetical protein
MLWLDPRVFELGLPAQAAIASRRTKRENASQAEPGRVATTSKSRAFFRKTVRFSQNRAFFRKTVRFSQNRAFSQSRTFLA